ncbi:PTS system glucitol/sorbitol-specific IIA component [Trichococcus patagoniensis]|uniref:PTS system glucitol/sorbitol-specific IIA component n=1 Tax=Trichococcus patagoniensis TaxID=382641 RepID=A0A2T5IJG1_9LACT|nr:PTS glucitol/sorbitol transporter subunit IIA [Trichococcus patagoniensis]PTQ83965.1 PTS system glucitol/sorbitol-specific IIA component [Trichococcus patagoniensis]
MYSTKVVEIGEMVPAFEEEMLLILFGPSATPELKSICVIHESSGQPDNILQLGTLIEMGGTTYTVTQVGDAANKNFDELGHVSIYFRSGENEILPGAIIAEPEVYPSMQPGDIIKIVND